MKKIFLNKIICANLILAMSTLFLFSRCHSGNANPGTKSDSAVTTAKSYDGQTDDNNNMLASIADQLNKDCPKQLDAETRWDNSVFNASTYTFQYNYTLVSMDNSQIDTTAEINQIQPNLINTFKNNPQMKAFTATKANFLYCYKDKKGAYSFRIVITPKQYSN